MKKTMTAVEITRAGGPDVLQPTARPVPVPRPGEVVIKVAWAGVNRPDALQRAGLYAPPPTASAVPHGVCQQPLLAPQCDWRSGW